MTTCSIDAPFGSDLEPPWRMLANVGKPRAGVRVLHVSQPVEAGVAHVVAGLVADQRERGWTVSVACPAGGWLPDTVAAAGSGWCPWEAARSPGPSVAREVAALAEVIERVDPHLVHVHSAKAGLAGRLAVRGRRPTIFQPHAWSFEAVSGPLAAASRAWERTAQRWTTLTICVSDAELATGRSAGVSGAAVVIPNGVDADLWTPRDRAASRNALGLAADAPTVVCIGRLARQKGQHLLVQAWSAVRRAVPNAQLVLVGSGPDEDGLRTVADESVRMVPGERLADWYAAADVVAVPSRWEAGLPLVAMEAMACARSVVAFDVAGIGASLQGAGLAVPPEDVEALAAALTARLVSPELAAREADVGRRRVIDQFAATTSRRSTAERVLELLENR